MLSSRNDTSERIKVPKSVFYTRISILVVSSTFLLFVLRYQDSFPSSLMSKVKKYNHPLFQAGVIYGSLAACFWLHWMTRNRHAEYLERQRSGKSFNFRWNQMVLPSVIDVVATLCALTGLMFMPEIGIFPLFSVFSLSFGFLIGSVWLKKEYRLHQYVGLMMVLVGVAGVAVWKAISFKDAYNMANQFTVGVGLLVLSQILVAVEYHVVENIFNHYCVPTMLACGLQGMYSWIIVVCLTFIANLLPCSKTGLCRQGYVSNTGEAFSDLFEFPVLLGLMCGVLLISGVYNYHQMYILKASSANAVLVSIALRICLVWGVELVESYQNFDPIMLICMVVLTIPGFLLYMEIVKIPWSNYQTNRNRSPRAGVENCRDSSDASFRLLIEGYSQDSLNSWDSDRIIYTVQDPRRSSSKSPEMNEKSDDKTN
mmetsp:Transcript_38882/g.44273  ORF Transcript_38882/g.44273 Transcript_38882/m.44273 type:complete len:427 (-) Transcript_38882:86-1366(-)